MVHAYRNSRNMMIIFSIALISTIIISSQFPIASAGLPGDSDIDGDGFSPNEGDCDDGNALRYPDHGCAVPIPDIKLVMEEVADIETINDGQANALLSKLQNAINKIESNQINGAIGSLKAFINQITVFINSGKISPEVGNPLIEAVNNIIYTLRMG